MSNDNVLTLQQPDQPADDPLTTLLRQGAQQLIAQAVEVEKNRGQNRKTEKPGSGSQGQVLILDKQ